MNERLKSLDAFRGITIAAMIVVNNPGSWAHVFPPLRHAEWHGWTPTDLVFPFFLFIVGVAISLALSRRIDRGEGLSSLYGKIVRRSLILFALGILLRLMFQPDLAHLRIPGVLQRIALCYLISAMVYPRVGPRGRAGTVFSLLLGYYVAMKLIPVPGYGAGVLEPKGNLCGYIDVKILGGHLYKPHFDPEGILSTLPAVATVLLGTLAGDWIRSRRGAVSKATGLLLTGLVLVALGLGLHPVFPINKQLWTSTFVLFTGGAAAVLLGIFVILMDGWRIQKGAFPFLVLGANAIFVYVGSTVLARIFSMIKILGEQGPVSVKTYVVEHLLIPWAGPQTGSLLFPILLLLFWIGVMIPLYQRKIFIRI
ncbi:MAG: acyltransferase family protein [Candidatus Aminicenantales bacterium]